MYSLLLALIYTAYISLGLPDSLLGAGWPAMYSALGVPVSYMGIVTMIISAGTIVSSLLSDRLTKKLGTPAVTVASVFLTAIALLGFSFSHRFFMLLIFSVPYGLGAGAIDAALNNYVALHYTSRHMSWLHCFWGVGTIISPFIMSRALSHSGWNDGYRSVAYIQIAIGLLLVVTLPVWKVGRGGFNDEHGRVSPGILNAIKIKGVPFLLLGFFAYCSAEATAMHWASTYLVKTKGLPEGLAAQFGSLFFIGMTVGRFFGGFIANRIGDRKMITFGTCVAFAGTFSLLIPTENHAVSLVGFVIIGLGCAPIYPCIIHSAPGNFGTENSGAVIGIQMASAYVGSTFAPPLYGFISDIFGFWVLPLFLAAFFTLMLFMTKAAFKTAAKNRLTRGAVPESPHSMH